MVSRKSRYFTKSLAYREVMWPAINGKWYAMPKLLMEVQHMAKHLLCILFTLMTVFPCLASVQNNDVYSADISIANQSPHSRQKAIEEALEAVLVKVSGDAALKADPMLAQLRAKASTLVEEFSYRQIPPEQQSTINDSAYILHVQFQPQAVQALLAEMGRDAWHGQRPLILVWLATKDPQQQKHLLTDDEQNPVVAAIKQMMQARGLPMIFPVLDLSSLSVISAETVWQGDIVTLSQMAERYATQTQFILRVQPDDVRGWRGDATLITDIDRFDFIANGDSEQTVLNSLVNQLSIRLAELNAPHQTQHQVQEITMTVNGVSDLDRYASLLTYLKRFSVIKDVQLVHFKGDQVEMMVTLIGSIKQLQQALSSERHLLASTAPLTEQTHLIYQWMS